MLDSVTNYECWKGIYLSHNDKNREDKEIMDWLDKAVYEGEYYENLTEAEKWAILCFIRGEIRFREEMTTIELMQKFVRDFAKQTMSRLCRMQLQGYWQPLSVQWDSRQAVMWLFLPCLWMMRKIEFQKAHKVFDISNIMW